MIKIRVKSFIIYVLILFSYISAFFPNEEFRYYDEALGIICIVYLVGSLFMRKTDAFTSKMLLLLMSMSVLGVLSNFLFELQYNYINVLIDLYLFLKTFFVFLSSYIYLRNTKDIDYLFDLLEMTVKILTIILFTSLMISLIFDTELARYDVWGKFVNLKVFVFFVKYPSLLAVYVGTLISILCCGKKNNIVYIAMNIIILFFTQAGLAYIMIFAFLALVYFFKFNKRIRWYHIALLVLGGTIVGYNEIATYFFDTSAARALLFRYAFVTALEFFPLGTGFSTYGGSIAAQQYAKLYYQYGFDNYWGMGPNEKGFYLNDTYYPMIIAQFGLVGTILYLVLFIYLFKQFNNVSNVNIKISLMFILIIILTANLGQGSVMSSAGVLLMFEAALLYKKNGSNLNYSNAAQ